ncbi:solute carrier family 26 member 6 [Takifugu flavidus]|uniref:solute carrier family 26 member 6 n=1 Tax=Takifugu flavidus TaxID=433684 RepID=UPI002544B38D|nr:solute carrier family 26 member 6 [Takifugu flavidus]
MAQRKRMAYNVSRDILDEETLDEIAEKADSNPSLCDKLKKSLRSSGPKAKKRLLGTLPIISWLPRYPFKENALGDLISGISVGIMQLPQGMAYALLASVPPVFGLYSSFYPVLIYFLFGTSKHISIGTYAVMSVMIGSVTERLAPESDFMTFDNMSNSSIVDLVSRDAARVRVAAAVTCLSGLFQVLLGLLQLGFLVTYLSEPLVRGYTTGAAIHVIVSQLKYTFGINPKRHNGPMSLIYTVLEVCYLVPKTNIGTLVVSIVAIICLILTKELNAYLSKKIPVPIPVELLGIVIATVISWQVNLNEQFGVDVVGKIPTGLQAPVVPDFSLFGQVIGDAFALAFVGYGIAISLGRIFALKYGYNVDSNQEFIALGLSNSIGGFFQCFAISCSMSRTMVQESTGGKTQVAGALSAIVILFITLWIGVLFQDLPKAVLAAIIYVNLHGMMKQFLDIPALWRTNKIDMVVWVVTFILTVLLNPDLGLLASLVFSLLTVIFRTQLPQYSRLGQIPNTDIYKPVEDYNQVREVPGIFIFRSSATLYYANAEMYQEALEKKSGFKINKILSAKKKLEAKREKFERKIAKKAAKKKTHEMVEETVKEDIAVIPMDYMPDPSLPRAIILDLSAVNFLDTVGVKTLRRIQSEYGQIGIEVFLACCQTGVVDNLKSGGFFNDKVTKSCLFSTIHDAVLHCQTSGILSPEQENTETYF